ncbi:TRAP transporter small permease [Arthrobacter sp. VKM Ac-2550]|uniref:TRAP transporter small permease n=1 Tax=Crystallibacter permensis TaxID=1938888 RepID=UPI002226F0B1|nr:TRAP transporter small permease subunit [Arthrobacter sp. VKM Ac-2550]MCW2131233.1 TRAP-type C4-dicarboxylate transport system, small permease component [Arthrobacter sp. VKM Ac-2550]
MVFDKALSIVEDVSIASAFFLLTMLAFINVVSRYALHASLSWSTEIVIGLAVYLIMIGTSAAIRANAHPNFSLLSDAASGHLRIVVTVVIGIALTGFMVLLLWLGMDMVTSQLESGRATAGLRIPQWVLSAALPLGAAFGILRSVQLTVNRIRHPKPLAEATELLPGG